jgi:hypothetical protein
MNELSATIFPLRSAKELQTDVYTAAGLTAECIVGWCSTVIVQKYYIFSACERQKKIK